MWHYLLTYLLTPWCRILLEQLTGFAASQEIPRISRNPKVHYRTHKRPPPVSILDLLNTVHIPTSHLLEIHPNIIHSSTPSSPQWSLSLRMYMTLYKLIKTEKIRRLCWIVTSNKTNCMYVTSYKLIIIRYRATNIGLYQTLRPRL